MSFTAEEYRTAAKVFVGIFPDIPGVGAVVRELDLLARGLEAHEEYADDLGMVGFADLPKYRGAKLLEKLLEDGWTPPEGLF